MTTQKAVMKDAAALFKNVDYRVRVDDRHNPKGPDGQGWNRMAIIGIGAHDRCSLQPITRQGALDTLRGMARLGVPTAYSDCISNTACHQCVIATGKKDGASDFPVDGKTENRHPDKSSFGVSGGRSLFLVSFIVGCWPVSNKNSSHVGSGMARWSGSPASTS